MRVSHPVDELLEARGSTKRWLAGKLRMKESTLSRYLIGDRPAPQDLYERIADVLHVPVTFLRQGSTEPVTPNESEPAGAAA